MGIDIIFLQAFCVVITLNICTMGIVKGFPESIRGELAMIPVTTILYRYEVLQEQQHERADRQDP
jgi:hypothetical protein